ncbi:MAG TPA: hypothetical protein VHI52_15800, partial [Verrucomicrobiae bacterium]|nr:hypothetical protein [Verrucomicrobiae bacterium]
MSRRIAAVCLVLTGGALVAGLLFRPAYLRFKEHTAVGRAQRFLARGELASASLSARQALLLNPTNAAACEIMAEVADGTWPPQALDWRRRLIALRPTIENKLRFAATALRVQGPPHPLASQVLEELRPVATNLVAYCNLRADLALRLNHYAEAETWIESASRLEPASERHRFNLAVLWLNHTNRARLAEARAILCHLESDTNFAVPALRCLALDKIRAGDLGEAQQLTGKLHTHPRAALQDQLLWLDVLYAEGSPQFTSGLLAVQRQVATNPAALSEVSSFLVHHGMAEQGRNWLQKQPKSIQRLQPMPLALVECHFALKDWTAAERLLEDAPWEEFEPMRLAFLSQAAFEIHDRNAAESRWRLAVSHARGRLGCLMWLAARAEAWGRQKERLELLWEIASEFPSERWALDELARSYLARGNTRSLHEVCTKLLALDPNDLSSRNNFANTALLLKTNLAQAHRVARELFSEHSGDPAVASTYAYSLYLQGRTNAALLTMET